MSMLIDYQHRTLTIGRSCSAAESDACACRCASIACDGARHAELHASDLLRRRHRRRGDFDQRGDRGALQPGGYRKIPLKVYGTSGWDRDAFLLPGMNLNFDQIEYKNMPLVVLNLRAPSVLLGFELGGIVGHNFLSHYRVALDMDRSELRLQKF
jgi:hypothetical protein